MDRILRPAEVRKVLAVGRSTLHAMVRRGDFPRALRITNHAVGWRLSTVEAWLAEREQDAGGSTPADSPKP